MNVTLFKGLVALVPTCLLLDGSVIVFLRGTDSATRRDAVLSVPLEQLASLWPLRLDAARVAAAWPDSAVAARACQSFQVPMGYVDQVVQPEVARLCGRAR